MHWRRILRRCNHQVHQIPQDRKCYKRVPVLCALTLHYREIPATPAMDVVMLLTARSPLEQLVCVNRHAHESN